MKTILLFGAGKSSSFLITYLLKECAIQGWRFIIADADKNQISSKTNNSALAEEFELDIQDNTKRTSLIERADVVISMMPPALHFLIAKDCVELHKHLLTASYLDAQIKDLSDKIKERGLLFLCEMGLDPGIDHMSAMKLLDEIHASGATVTSFKSHCGGLVAPESDDNPWHYKISWNPRNIVLAGKSGAVYKLNGEVITENYESLFNSSRKVITGNEEVPMLSYYPNRDSLAYIDIYRLHNAETFIRTTLRYADFMTGWKNVIELKLTDETPLYETDGKTLQEIFRNHLHRNGFEKWLQQNLTQRFSETKNLLENLLNIIEVEEKAKESGEAFPENFMLVNQAGDLKDIEVDEIKNYAAEEMATRMHEANLIMKQLFYLGLEDNQTVINKGLCSAADVLQIALEKKLALQPGDKDMIAMLHDIEFTRNEKKYNVYSSLFVNGDDHIHTAMAKTVGLPLGIAAKLLLTGSLKVRGLYIPVTKEIYEPVLNELENHGITFKERWTDLP